jgi:hypothetical protein
MDSIGDGPCGPIEIYQVTLRSPDASKVSPFALKPELFFKRLFMTLKKAI